MAKREHDQPDGRNGSESPSNGSLRSQETVREGQSQGPGENLSNGRGAQPWSMDTQSDR